MPEVIRDTVSLLKLLCHSYVIDLFALDLSKHHQLLIASCCNMTATLCGAHMRLLTQYVSLTGTLKRLVTDILI